MCRLFLREPIDRLQNRFLITGAYRKIWTFSKFHVIFKIWSTNKTKGHLRHNLWSRRYLLDATIPTWAVCTDISTIVAISPDLGKPVWLNKLTAISSSPRVRPLIKTTPVYVIVEAAMLQDKFSYLQYMECLQNDYDPAFSDRCREDQTKIHAPVPAPLGVKTGIHFQHHVYFARKRNIIQRFLRPVKSPAVRSFY